MTGPSLGEYHAEALLKQYLALSPSETHTLYGPLPDHDLSGPFDSQGRLDAYNLMARRTRDDHGRFDGGVEVVARVNLPSDLGPSVGEGYFATLAEGWGAGEFRHAAAACCTRAEAECHRLAIVTDIARLHRRAQERCGWTAAEPDYGSMSVAAALAWKENLALWLESRTEQLYAA